MGTVLDVVSILEQSEAGAARCAHLNAQIRDIN